MNLEDITLSEISQSQKDKHCSMPLNEVPRGVSFTETGGRVPGVAEGGLVGTEFQFGLMEKFRKKW